MEFRYPAGLLQRAAATMRPPPSSFDGDKYNQASYTRPSFDCYNQVSHLKPSGVVEIHSLDQWKAVFNASMESGKLMVIEFTAMWCGPCKKMEPMVQEFAAQYIDVEFVKIDTDKLNTVAMEFEVCTMPCFVFLKKGMAVDKVEGVKPPELQSKIETHRASSIWY